MNDHRTEQQLIDYAFDLADEAATRQTRTHLDRCEACRRKLDELRSKFAALELLRGRIEASDDLLSQTVSAATVAAPRRIWLFRGGPWLGAAAAVIVLGVSLLVIPNLTPDRSPLSEPEDRQVLEDKGFPQVESDSPRASEVTTVATAEKELAFDAPAPGQPTRGHRGDAGKDRRAAAPPLATAPPVMEMMAAKVAPLAREADDAIDDKPPFAPASAIELVVLPRRQDVQVTIYNSADLTLVRERRNLTMKKGWNWLQFMWAQTLIDPTSLTLEPLEHKDRVEIQQLVFPPRLRELGRWLIRSEVSGQVSFELTYLTSGLSWRAFYMGTLSPDETTMDLQAYVRVHNQSGEDYENAQTRLIVGKVHLLEKTAALARRQYPYGGPGSPTLLDRLQRLKMPSGAPAGQLRGKDLFDLMNAKVSYALPPEPKEVRKEGLSEYFLYTIEGTETIPNQWAKRLLSFETENIPVTSLYKYDEQRWGREPIRFVSFANDTEHELGETPIPNGAIRIYGRADTEGHLSYTGGTEVKYIPVGEEVELNLGPARLVKVEPVLMNFRTENYVYDNKDDIEGWDEVRTWKVEIANARTLPVDIEITRGFPTARWELESSDPGVSYEKHDVTRARFKLNVQPRSKRTFTYTVTTYHGAREQVLIQKERNQPR